MLTTLNKIRAHGPCADGWTRLLRNLGKCRPDDEPLSIATILEFNGLEAALWCLRAVDGFDREIRLYAVWCVRQVGRLMDDPSTAAVLEVAERHAHGAATDAELAAANAAAWGPVKAATGSRAGGAAMYAASASASAAARYAASDKASSDLRHAASAAASAEAWRATWRAASYAQVVRLREICAELQMARAEHCASTH
jgi:hypothetical protein